jgi:hypothetical protein
MKNSKIFFALGLIMSVNVYAEKRVVSNKLQDSVVVKTWEPSRNLEFTMGFIPRTTVNALKLSASVNNILLERVGVYTSLEKGMNSDYFSNIYGITVSAGKYIQLWSGVGWFAKSELFKRIEWRKVRKEIGVGITPYKMTVINLGWSYDVGPTIAIGIKIPVNPKSNRHSLN